MNRRDFLKSLGVLVGGALVSKVKLPEEDIQEQVPEELVKEAYAQEGMLTYWYGSYPANMTVTFYGASTSTADCDMLAYQVAREIRDSV